MSSFTTPLRVEVLDDFKGNRIIARLLEGFAYDVGELGSGETITVPAGFITDFASIPRGLWNFEPPLGRAGKAAVIHDWIYAQGGNLLERTYSRAQADRIFRAALKVLGVPAWKRALMWAAVRLGGAGGWGRKDEPGPV